MKFEYLDPSGLSTLVAQIKALVASIAGKVTNTPAATTKAYITGTKASAESTDTQVFDPGVYLDTTAGQLVATTFKGNLTGNATTASTASKLDSNAGSLTKPIYFNQGVPQECTYALNATVPADAKFTDTVYTLPTASSTVLGGVKTTSSVTTTTGLTACPIIGGVPYYENTTYTLSSFGVTATAAELNVLDGITASVTELNYCDGVTSSIQTQLDGKLSTTGKAASATVADSANAVAWTNVTGKPTIPAVTKVTFTATDSKWGTATDGRYPLTIAASGGEFLNCYRTNGSVYDKVEVDVTVSGTNIIIYSLDKFAGYVTYLA